MPWNGQCFPHTSANQMTLSKWLLWCAIKWPAKVQVCPVDVGCNVAIVANEGQLAKWDSPWGRLSQMKESSHAALHAKIELIRGESHGQSA